MLTQILRYSRRVKQLGCKNLFITIKNRFNKKLFKFRFYKKNKLNLPIKFETLWTQFKQNETFQIIFEELVLPTKSIDASMAKAELAIQNKFTLLGSQQVCFEKNKIEWQKDFKSEQLKSTHKILENQWQNQKNIFYQDIKISSPKNIELKEYNPDIKVPWELSRFQHLTDLVIAYKKTSDPKFINTITHQVESWIKCNPLGRGVNWVCPMDTAIRATNWILALDQLKKDEKISINFFELVTHSLYEHAIFIENNWEWADKPNNHYLSDLLGYLYLCEFFKHVPKFKTAKQKTIDLLLKQFFHQVLPDGTAYEGSTNYHKLDTEIFLHFKYFCQATQTPLPKEFHDRIEKMIEFLRDCTDCAGNLVQIGDNDSGKIVGGMVSSHTILTKTKSHLKLKKLDFRSYGFDYAPNGASLTTNGLHKPVRPECSECDARAQSNGYERVHQIQNEPNELIKTYPNFGLTIIKNKNLHLTFRHATFNSIQPTGHFHQDELAITLSVGGIPVLVDPGTYLYTANAKYRNLFRSYESHNTFYCKQELKFDDLFQLKRAENPVPREISREAWKLTEGDQDGFPVEPGMTSVQNHKFRNKANISFKSSHKTEFATAWRQLDLNLISNEIKISDYAESKKNNDWAWNLIFAPGITLEKIDTNFWEIKKEKNILLLIQTTLNFEETSWFYSAEYGKIESCKKLTAQTNLNSIESITIKLLIY